MGRRSGVRRRREAGEGRVRGGGRWNLHSTGGWAGFF